MGEATLGAIRTGGGQDGGSRVVASRLTACEELMREDPKRDVGCGTGCPYGVAERRTHWASMAGSGLRELSPACPTVGRPDGERINKDRGIRKRCSSRFGARPCTQATPGSESLPSRNGLGLCELKDEGQATVVARFALAQAWQACVISSRDYEKGLLPHVPSHLWDAAQRQRRKPQSRAGNC